MLVLRKTPKGAKYFELNRQMPRSLPATKNHQEGLTDPEDESDGKIFAVPGYSRCPCTRNNKKLPIYSSDQEAVATSLTMELIRYGFVIRPSVSRC